jgi:hypothetical protein
MHQVTPKNSELYIKSCQRQGQPLQAYFNPEDYNSDISNIIQQHMAVRQQFSKIKFS